MRLRKIIIYTIVKLFVFVVLLGGHIDSATAAETVCTDSAQQYWKAFRQAVLQGKLSVVADLSRFPFELGGTLDNSERRHVLRKEFIRLFPSYLKADPGLSPAPTTMKSLLKVTAYLSPSFCNSYGNQFRVGTWVFELTPQGWRFVQAFVDDQ